MVEMDTVKNDSKAIPPGGPYLSGRTLYARGFWSGVIGATVMVVAALLFNWLFGLETLMERIQQISIKFLPGQFFEFGIKNFGQDAKPIQLIVISLAIIFAGGLLGLLYVRLFGKHSVVAADDPSQPAAMFRDRTLLRTALIYALAIWVAFFVVIIPLLETIISDQYVYRGVGVFGTNYHPSGTGLLFTPGGPVAYSILTLLMFLSFGLVNAFVFQQDVVATTRAWREKLAATGTAADAPDAPSPSRRRTLRYIAGGIAAAAAAVVFVIPLISQFGLGSAGTGSLGTGRPADTGPSGSSGGNTQAGNLGAGTPQPANAPTDTPEPDTSAGAANTPVSAANTPAANPPISAANTPAANPPVSAANTPAPSTSTQPLLSDAGMPAEATSNQAFYHVSKNSQDPIISRDGWTLSVQGLVDNPYSLTYDQLAAMPTIERYVTLSCISNPVGGNLIGTAKWRGVPLVNLLKKAGVQSGAKRVVFKAGDDYTDSITLDTAMHSYNLLALGMNGVDLPNDHGAPARLLIPGIYGMKNVKWLNTIILSEDAGYKGFWQAQGWDNAAPTRTMSILFIPRRDSTQPNQPLLIGGIAFAGDRGISKVEVSTDGGQTWNKANLRTPKSTYSWALWTWPWTPGGPSQYTIKTRATDKNGTQQRSDVTDAFPSGVEAYDSAKVTIAG